MPDITVVRDDLPPKQAERRHLISIADLTRDDVERLLATAQLRERRRPRGEEARPARPDDRERLLRVLADFVELRARGNCLADTMSIKLRPAVDKGESLKDTRSRSTRTART